VETDLQALRLQLQRVEALVQDLLDYTGGGPRGALDRFPVRTLAEAALATVRGEAGDSSLDFSLTLETGADALLRADERRMELALLNILRNARQAAASAVELAVHSDDDFVFLEVRDDGPCLADAPEVLLQPFWSSKPSGEGSGLGLAISAAIVEEHGGKLSLRNGSVGAIVTLSLPRDADPAGGGALAASGYCWSRTMRICASCSVRSWRPRGWNRCRRRISPRRGRCSPSSPWRW
jgi:signal transduction histidine kinase